MTVQEIDDKIGKATYEAYILGMKFCSTWNELSPMFKSHWIAAGCAARNVVIQDVQEVDEFKIGMISEKEARMSPPVEPSPSDTPSPS